MLNIEKIIIPIKYLEYLKFFFPNFIRKLLKYININNHLINLINDKKPPYSPIYSLKLIKLKILKIYIRINLANDFIEPFKLYINISIMFIHIKKTINFSYVLIIKISII